MRKLQKSHGFTLIELSIVLVIIGLIVGGVLVGRDLIRTAELQNLVIQIDKFRTAIYTFQDKYSALPGDMTNATTLWGQAADCSQHAAAGVGTATCNGDGNQEIDPGSREMYLFWQHLSNAGLVQGTYSGAYGSGSGAWSDVIDTNIPSTRIANYGVEMWYNDSFTNGNIWTPMTYKNLYWVNDSGNLTTPTMTPAEAYRLDSKYDDGLPGSGRIMTYAGGGGGSWNCATTGDPTTATYNMSLSTLQCFLIFDSGF